MGYRKKNTTYRLSFGQDTPYDGFEFVARSANIGQLFQFAELRTGTETITAENVGTVRELYDMFATRLIEWNLTDDDDEPIDCNATELADLEHPQVMAMLYAWMDAIQGVVAPLLPASLPGELPTPDGIQQLRELELTMLVPDPILPPNSPEPDGS